MEFTIEGKQHVQSLEFARKIRPVVSSVRTEELGTALALSMIAWAATGHNEDIPPTKEEAIELGQFANSHVSELNAFAGVGLKLLVDYDCGTAVH